METTYQMDLGGRTLKVILGKTAKQADGAAWVQYGDTVLHIAVVSGRERREGMDFLPLSVDYREKLFAAGRIPGGFFKREGRPHEPEILNARIIDRPIRPLFPEGYYYETQVMAMVLSADKENEAAVLGPLAASIALNISDIPMNEIIASVRIGLGEDGFIINPTYTDLETSRLNMMLVGSKDAITMVEGSAREISNDELIEAFSFGHNYIKEICAWQSDFVDKHRQPTREYEVIQRDETLEAIIKKEANDTVLKIANTEDKGQRKTLQAELTKNLTEQYGEEDSVRLSQIKGTIHDMLGEVVRQNILNENRRIDGRKDTDVRNIEVEVGILPRVHGSALFTRGQTQALASATLGTKLDEQRVDFLDEVGYRKFMLHYNFPPYCTGEARPSFGVSRREIGHGKLGERAIEAVLPPWDDFPYTIRVVSDVMESNGSSSMASVCAGSLALMDAGVPLKKAVAGIAMGLIIQDDKYRILTDILGDEDHIGDMDFKVAGTRDGITSFQMDIKVKGISPDLMAKALNQARDARHHILDCMDAVISSPRGEVSPYAPRFIMLKIPVDRIGALIGPGGKNIREIIASTGTTVDVEDDGTVRIGAIDTPSAEEARKRVNALTEVPVVGRTYEGTIKRIVDFGAFVEIIPGTEGLMHISEIDHKRVNKVSDYFQVGDTVKVKLQRLDPDGKMDLSRKALLENTSGDREEKTERGDRGKSSDRGFNRGKGGNRR